MKINKIIKLKNNKYKLILDDCDLITYDDVIIKNNLLYKKEIDTILYNDIVNQTEYFNVYNNAIKYIMKKRRSEKEVRSYLNKFNIDIDSIIFRLKSINLINDIDYTKAYINDQIYLSNTGINKIKVNLLEQDIPIEIIDSELSKIDSNVLDNKLEKIIIKKIKANSKYSNIIIKQKILNEMINLGYSKDKILEIIDNNLLDNKEILNKEFNKLYNSFKNKYDNYNLKLKLKKRLVSKGFNISDINILIDKIKED